MRRRGSGRPLAAAVLALGWVAMLVAPVPARAAGPEPPPPASDPVAEPPPATPPSDVPMGNDGDPLYLGSDPNRHPQNFAPFSIIKYPGGGGDPRSRGVKVTRKYLELIQGGELVRKVPFDASQPVAFEAIARAVGDKAWIAETGPGVFGLRAAFVQAEGTTVTFVAPGTRELRLATDPPGVFVGGRGPSTAARFEGVKVTSWNLDRREPSQDVDAARPFVDYEEGARLDIAHSEFAYLGSDRVAAYGVSFRKETTGEATDSVFHHNFFGVYTFGARDVVFRRNVFRDNLFYGLDPHDGTTGILAEDNETYRNGTHGIVFSAQVTGGTLRNNHAHDNGLNGIVMDRKSDHNVITGNRVEHNGRDGIVLLGSSDNVVEDNVISGHRVAVRTNQPSARNVVRRNRIEGNQIGLEAYGGATGLTILDNQLLGNSRTGLILEAPGSTVVGGKVSGSTIGIDVRSADAALSGVAIDNVDNGVVVRPGAKADLQQLSVQARRVGIHADGEGVVAVRRSDVRAEDPTRGTVQSVAENRFIGPRLLHRAPWLAVAGVIAVACAIGLEVVQLVRERRGRSRGAWTTA